MDTEPMESRAELHEPLLAALESDDLDTVGRLVRGRHPAELADLVEAAPRELRPGLWREVAPSAKGEVLTEVRREVRRQLIEATGRDELLAALGTLESDELADLDADLPAPVADAMVSALDPRRRAGYEAVRAYPDDTAGGLMDVDAAAVRGDVSLESVLRYLRRLRARNGALPEHLDSLVVVDRGSRYRGLLKLSDAVSLDPSTPVGEAMTTGVPALPAATPAAQVARLFEDRDLLSAPVVDGAGVVLGRITVDDVVDVIRGEAEHEIMGRAGLDRSTDMFAPLLPSAGRRGLWLGVNLVNAFVAAWVIGLFEETIDKLVALAVLMPVVASMGGVAGNQTLALVTRGLALEQIGRANAWRLLLREVAVGLLNGVFWALVVGVVAALWFSSPRLGAVFAAALALNLLTGALAGTLVPLLLHRLRVDPALAGGVALTAATDVVGFFAFLGLATVVFG